MLTQTPSHSLPTIPIGSHAHEFHWSWDVTQWHRPIIVGQGGFRGELQLSTAVGMVER